MFGGCKEGEKVHEEAFGMGKTENKAAGGDCRRETEDHGIATTAGSNHTGSERS